MSSYLNLKLDDFRDMSVFIFDYVVITSDTHIVKPIKNMLNDWII